MESSAPPTIIPDLKLDIIDSDTDSETGDTDDLNLSSLSLQQRSSTDSTPSTTNTTSSTLSPSRAHTARPPSSTLFKVPAPPSKSLNAFPMLNSHQRVSGPTPGRRKVPLEPGHSPLDWTRLTTSNTNLRGVTQLSRYTFEEISQHRKRDDVWMAIQGKVYNVTHYLKFHPGGAGQLMRGAGKDATELFLSIHPWVNVDVLLEKCLVGYLVK